MTDITLNNIGHGFNRAKINENFDKIEAIINNEILHLIGGNNILAQNIDMNSFQIINLPDAINAQEPATLSQLNSALISIGAEAVVPLIQPRQNGDGSTIVFSTPATGQTDKNSNSFFVWLDGVSQLPLVDYSISTVDGNITFVEAPEEGVLVDITFFSPATITGTGASGTFTSADAKTVSVTDGLITSIV